MHADARLIQTVLLTGKGAAHHRPAVLKVKEKTGKPERERHENNNY